MTVECYSGHTYAQEPRAFVWQGERHVIKQIWQTWREPSGLYFKVETESGVWCTLVYDETQDLWRIEI